MKHLKPVFLVCRAVAASAARAQDRPAMGAHRLDEDWRPWCAANAQAEGLERLKCVRLADDALLAFGGELRERVEVLENPGFGLKQNEDHVFLHRAMLHADLRMNDNLRAFAQVGALGYRGRQGERGPFDLDHRTSDATYAPPLRPIAGTAGAPGRFIGHQAIAGLEWRPRRGVALVTQ